MELLSKELFEAVRKEYPDFSAAEAIAFVQTEYLAHIAKNTGKEFNDRTYEHEPIAEELQGFKVMR